MADTNLVSAKKKPTGSIYRGSAFRIFFMIVWGDFSWQYLKTSIYLLLILLITITTITTAIITIIGKRNLEQRPGPQRGDANISYVDRWLLFSFGYFIKFFFLVLCDGNIRFGRPDDNWILPGRTLWSIQLWTSVFLEAGNWIYFPQY